VPEERESRARRQAAGEVRGIDAGGRIRAQGVEQAHALRGVPPEQKGVSPPGPAGALVERVEHPPRDQAVILGGNAACLSAPGHQTGKDAEHRPREPGPHPARSLCCLRIRHGITLLVRGLS